MHDWQKEHIVRLKEKEDWSWKMIGTAMDVTPDAARMFYKKYKLIQDIEPKPVLPKKRILGGVNAIKVMKHQLKQA